MIPVIKSNFWVSLCIPRQDRSQPWKPMYSSPVGHSISVFMEPVVRSGICYYYLSISMIHMLSMADLLQGPCPLVVWQMNRRMCFFGAPQTNTAWVVLIRSGGSCSLDAVSIKSLTKLMECEWALVRWHWWIIVPCFFPMAHDPGHTFHRSFLNANWVALHPSNTDPPVYGILLYLQTPVANDFICFHFQGFEDKCKQKIETFGWCFVKSVVFIGPDRVRPEPPALSHD